MGFVVAEMPAVVRGLGAYSMLTVVTSAAVTLGAADIRRSLQARQRRYRSRLAYLEDNPGTLRSAEYRAAAAARRAVITAQHDEYLHWRHTGRLPDTGSGTSGAEGGAGTCRLGILAVLRRAVHGSSQALCRLLATCVVVERGLQAGEARCARLIFSGRCGDHESRRDPPELPDPAPHTPAWNPGCTTTHRADC